MTGINREARLQRIYWRGVALLIAYNLAVAALILWETLIDDLSFVRDEQNSWIVIVVGSLIVIGEFVINYAAFVAPVKKLQQRT